MKNIIPPISLATLLLAGAHVMAETPGNATPTVEELWKIIQQQQAEIETVDEAIVVQIARAAAAGASAARCDGSSPARAAFR